MGIILNKLKTNINYVLNIFLFNRETIRPEDYLIADSDQQMETEEGVKAIKAEFEGGAAVSYTLISNKITVYHL